MLQWLPGVEDAIINNIADVSTLRNICYITKIDQDVVRNLTPIFCLFTCRWMRWGHNMQEAEKEKIGFHNKFLLELPDNCNSLVNKTEIRLSLTESHVMLWSQWRCSISFIISFVFIVAPVKSAELMQPLNHPLARDHGEQKRCNYEHPSPSNVVT